MLFYKTTNLFFRSFANILHPQYNEAITVLKCVLIVNVHFGEYIIVTAQFEGVNFTLVVTK